MVGPIDKSTHDHYLFCVIVSLQPGKQSTPFLEIAILTIINAHAYIP